MQQQTMPLATQGRRQKRRIPFGGVYNSRANHDPEATQNQRVAILQFFRQNPNRKLSVDDIINGADINPSQTSVSSSVRDLRKKKYGGFNIPSGYDKDGIFKYCFVMEVKNV
jgi:hypothetical protein